MKRLLSLLLAIVVTVGCVRGTIIGVNAITDYTTGETEDGIGYSIDNETDELTVTYADFSTTDLVIPAYIDGHPVTAIGDNLLNDTPNPNLKSVVIPDTVKRIGFYAFGNCINLESVVMSENIEYVEDYAFVNTALTNNTDEWEDGALYLGKFLYGVSTDLYGEFKVKDGTRVLGSFCFSSRRNWSGCKDLTSIIIPDSVVQIGLFAFYNCTGLTSIDIPDSVRYIGNVAFGNCANLSEININTSYLTYIGENLVRDTAFIEDESNWQDDVLYLNTAALCGRNTITDLQIKEGTEIIADYAFACNDNIVSVCLPSSLKTICPLAFDDLHNLPSITLPYGLEYIANNAFDGCDLLTELDIPYSVKYIGLFAFNRTDNLKKLIIRNPNCTIIDNHEAYAGGAYTVHPNTTVYGYAGSTAEAFANNNDIPFEPFATTSGVTGNCTWVLCGTELIIKGKGMMADYDSSNAPWGKKIERLIIEEGVTNIGRCAFQNCTKLTCIDIPETVTSIGLSAFSGCISIPKIHIHKNVNYIGNYAFHGCTDCIISVDSDNPIFDSRNDCNAIIETDTNTLIHGSNFTVIPNNVSAIGERAFASATKLSQIAIPNSITQIGEAAFLDCSKLTALTIPDSVTTIGESAFVRCSGLTSIMVDENNPVYDSRNDCNAIIETDTNKLILGCPNTVIPENINSIGDDAFGEYSDILQANIPDSVNEIGERVYFKCSNLTDVCLGNHIKSIGLCAFYECSGLKSIDLPEGVSSIARLAFKGCKKLESIIIPESVTEIGDYAFLECPNLTIYGHSGSYAETYARNNGIKFSLVSYGICPNCQNSLTNHTVVDSSCTELGYYLSICDYCGKEVKDSSKFKLAPHTPVTDEGYPATCTENGLTDGNHCSVCGDILEAQNTIPALGHAYVAVPGTEPTRKHSGLTDGVKCSRCGEWLIEQEIIPMLPTILGDVDGDGDVSAIDVTWIARYLVNMPLPEDFDEKAADIDGNGYIDSVDETLLKRYAVQMNVPFPIGEEIT